MTRILNFFRKVNPWVWGLLVLLLVIRLTLPYGIKRSLNYYLGNKIENYQGKIADFDLSLWRGAYQIEALKLWKKGTNPDVPLLYAREIDLSLAWRALFRGEFLGDLRVHQLNLNIVDSTSKEKKQTGADEKGWQEVLGKLVPLRLESVIISDSQLHFLNTDYKVPVDIYADQVHLAAHNLKNTDDKKELLPSTVRITGRLQSDANFTIAGKLNALRNPPAFNIDAQVQEFTLEKINPLLLVYGPFTFARGNFSMYAEIAAKDGNIKGYVKPFFENMKMVANKERFISFKHGFYEFLLGTSNLVVRNSVRDAATKVEFEGAMKSPDIDVWGAVWTALKNGFGKSVKPGIENSISVKDVPQT